MKLDNLVIVTSNFDSQLLLSELQEVAQTLFVQVLKQRTNGVIFQVRAVILSGPPSPLLLVVLMVRIRLRLVLELRIDPGRRY